MKYCDLNKFVSILAFAIILTMLELTFPFFTARKVAFAQASSNSIPSMQSASTVTQVEDDSLTIDIPERNWRTEGFEGRELTKDIAGKFPAGNFKKRNISKVEWGVGENLVFSVKYGFYRAGTATMSILPIIDVNGGSCYHIQTKANSNDFISKFYKVRDVVNSYLDVDGCFSRRFEKRLREGKYKSDRITDFYQDRCLALNTKEKHAVTKIPLYVQDVLSSLYYIRTYDLAVGRDEYIDVYADGKVYPLRVIVHKRETIEVPAGKFKCIKIEPMLKYEGIFKQDGKLTVWITDDEIKMPVKMKSKVLIGSIGTVLESYSPGKVD